MPRSLVFLLAVLCAIPVSGQALVCPPTPATTGRPCEIFHFHAQVWNPETRSFVALHGTNEFSSMAACEKARDARVKQNADVVDYVKRVRGQQQYEADRIGPCHCDATTDPASTTYLDDARRLGQVRLEEDLRRRVREKLLDLDLTTDSPLVASLTQTPVTNPMLAGARLTPLPPPAAAVVQRSVEDLKMPKAVQPANPASASINLPLAPVDASGIPSIAAVTPKATPAVPVPQEGTPAIPPKEAAPEVIETVVADDAQPPVAETGQEGVIDIDHDSVPSAQEAADAFVRFETERIQNVVNAIPDQADETGEKVLEACTARIQALSNLRSLILGSGSSSRIAQAARAVQSEDDRVELVKKLFGHDVAAHWIPRVTTDVVLPPSPEVEDKATALLRESNADATDAMKRRALYTVLSRAPLTEEQQLWLIPIVDRLVQ